ncbi:CDP-glycerol glycerophosphotransferase family protein [Shewanella waksmanii]|uniref:CDP-glycerol glycerophosphotransferase family protein n=1 Tax=Shewanella waksmanii TaxID=213783 RepID=UPI003734F89A
MSELIDNLPNNQIAVVGTGNLSLNLEGICRTHGLETQFFVDEFREGTYLGKPIHNAGSLTQFYIESVSIFLIAISNDEFQTAAKKRLINHGVPSSKIMIIGDDPGLQILNLLFEKFDKVAVKALLSNKFSTLNEIEKFFLKNHWQSCIKNLSPNKKNIVLGYYGRGGGFRRHIYPLIQSLSPDFNIVSLSDESLDKKYEAPNHLYMSTFSACNQHWIDLAITAHVFPCAPRNIPRVTFSHIIYDFNLSDDYHAARIGEPSTHYLFASSKPCFEWYKNLIDQYELKNKLCIIPGGYLQLDQNIEIAKAYKGAVKDILYAPTLALADYPHKELASNLSYGLEIIKQLIESFPDKNIIFRPHPSDIRLLKLGRHGKDTMLLGKLIDFCYQHPSCIVDENTSDYMQSYNKSALLITDTSSTAFTYAFTTNRPVVFFSPNENDLNKNLPREMKFIKDRTEVGYIAKSIGELTDIISMIFSNHHNQKSTSSFKNETIYNIGSAEKYFKDNINYILSNKKHPDWHYVNWKSGN